MLNLDVSSGAQEGRWPLNIKDMSQLKETVCADSSLCTQPLQNCTPGRSDACQSQVSQKFCFIFYSPNSWHDAGSQKDTTRVRAQRAIQGWGEM